MDSNSLHIMVRISTDASGRELWRCALCGRQLFIEWQAHAMYIRVADDADGAPDATMPMPEPWAAWLREWEGEL